MKRRLATVVAFAVGVAVAPTGAGAQTLDEVLAYAYNNNPTLTAQRSALRGVDENVPIARSGWRPSVSLSGSTGFRHTDNNRGGTQDLTPAQIGLQVTQPLYDGGITRASVSEAEAGVLAGRAQLLSVEQAILLDAATAYLDVVRDQAVLDLSIQNVEVLQRQLEAAQDRFRVGEITRTDVAQAEARLSGAVADREQSVGNLQASRANFEQVVGVPPGELDAPEPVLVQPDSIDAVLARAREQNPGVLEATYNALAAQNRIEVIHGQTRPSVSLDGSVAHARETQADGSRTDSAELLVNLTVPLYQSGAVQAQVRQQKHFANQAQLQVSAARRTAVEGGRQAWEALQASRARVESLTAQIRAAEIAVEGVQREAEVGARTTLDVLDAQLELFQAQVNLVVARRDELVRAFQLKQALGEMTARALELPVDFYDPTGHYEEVRGLWYGTAVRPVLAEEKLID